MENKYYYLVASLPYLEFDKPPLITKEQFLSESGKWLTRSDYRKLSGIDIHDPYKQAGDPAVISKWKSFDRELREELAEIRKEFRKSDSRGETASFKDVFGQANPLFMEKKLERKKWDFLEGIEADYHFDINELVIYFLKLQILERLASFDKEKGKEKFEILCEVKYG